MGNWLAIVMVLSAVWGCGGKSEQEAICAALPGCGGRIDGTWQFDSMCVQGDLARALDSLSSLPQACQPLFRQASLDVAGTITFADGTQTVDGTRTMTMTAVYTSACLSAAVGGTVTLNAETCASIQEGTAQQGSVSSGTCTFADGTCTCNNSKTTTAVQSGAYAVSGSTITYANGDKPTEYCVSGTTLHMSQALPDAPDVKAVASLHRVR